MNRESVPGYVFAIRFVDYCLLLWSGLLSSQIAGIFDLQDVSLSIFEGH